MRMEDTMRFLTTAENRSFGWGSGRGNEFERSKRPRWLRKGDLKEKGANGSRTREYVRHRKKK